MSIQIHVPTPMRAHADQRAVVEVEGTTVQGALNELGKRYPGLWQRVFENGQVRRFINIYVNDEDIRYLNNLDTGVKDGDSLSIVPAVAGG
jgi:MoaD family protein